MNVHRQAIEAAIEAAGPRLTDVDRPLLALARALADQVDATGADGPGTRLAGTYLTTVRTLQARVGVVAVPKVAGKLADLRAHRARMEPTKTTPAAALRRTAGTDS